MESGTLAKAQNPKNLMALVRGSTAALLIICGALKLKVHPI